MSSIVVPSKLDEKIIYIWKIIDRKTIDWKELVYYIAFELHLTTPENAKMEILEAVKQGILKGTSNNQLSLNDELQKKFEEFQKQGVIKYRKMLGRLKDSWGIGPQRLQKTPTSGQKNAQQPSDVDKVAQNQSLQAETRSKSQVSERDLIEKKLEKLTVKSTVQSGMKIKEADISFETIDFQNGIISGKIKGSEATPYTFQIDAQMKVLSHNCVDFSMKRVKKKEICKHLVKIFEVLLKNPDEKAKKIIDELIESKLSWNFNG